tara:strand:+ start:159 stop:365 length:207 start_codon:yes stop_codon:yes gene_type:complete
VQEKLKSLLNNLKLKEVLPDYRQSISDNEIELLRIVDVLSGEFRIGNDMDGFRVKKKLKGTTANKKDK